MVEPIIAYNPWTHTQEQLPLNNYTFCFPLVSTKNEYSLNLEDTKVITDDMTIYGIGTRTQILGQTKNKAPLPPPGVIQSSFLNIAQAGTSAKIYYNLPFEYIFNATYRAGMYHTGGIKINFPQSNINVYGIIPEGTEMELTFWYYDPATCKIK